MSDASVTLDIRANFSFYGFDSRLLMTLTPDGKLILGPGLSADEATQEVAKLLKLKYEEMR